ncbi:MAG TPA: hypothetical protein VGF01_14685 [Terracidiphilus sp.]|jgi:hypothetical protein
MTTSKARVKGTKYRAEFNNGWPLDSAPDDQLEQWAADPDCVERDQCRTYLAERLAKRGTLEPELQRAIAARQDEWRIAGAAKREDLQNNPFDALTEVSADARHIAGTIVKQLWIIFVALPFVLAILYGILR